MYDGWQAATLPTYVLGGHNAFQLTRKSSRRRRAVQDDELNESRTKGHRTKMLPDWFFTMRKLTRQTNAFIFHDFNARTSSHVVSRLFACDVKPDTVASLDDSLH